MGWFHPLRGFGENEMGTSLACLELWACHSEQREESIFVLFVAARLGKAPGGKDEKTGKAKDMKMDPCM